MLRIRRLQEKIDAEYLQDRMRTPVHLCIGQEAIAVGVCKALCVADTISSNHRGHGHYLAKGGDLKALVAELHCRSTGCSGGYGGSMHIVDISVGHMGSSSIVAGGIPIGTGHALAFRMRGESRVSAVFFGDGASEEGVLYESIHFAVLRRLPVIYVLENNGWAVCSPLSSRGLLPSIFHQGFPRDALPSFHIDGNDVEAVWSCAADAAERARSGKGPSFIECHTYRIPGHAGCAAQDLQGYRSSDEVESWRKKCPIRAYKEKLLAEKIMTMRELENMEKEISEEISDAFAFALGSPFPSPAEVAGTVYCE